MKWDDIKGVEPLNLAEPAFIQVLLPGFKLNKFPSGCTLNIEFGEKDYAITHRLTKERIRRKIHNFKRKKNKYQFQFDEILLNKSIGSISFNDPGFRFRYASGGTLPILQMNDKEYFCLFFRDVFPVGWNIANGGCDSLTELLDPTITIYRELREELIILGLKKNTDYIFRAPDGDLIENPDFEMARELWNAKFPSKNLRNLNINNVDVEWIEGPDRISTIFTSKGKIPVITNSTTSCFINITTDDFSIEIDKIAKIPVEKDVILLDGEISNHKILGRPIGLFEVEKTINALNKNKVNFYPDIIYYFGNPSKGGKAEIEKIVLRKHVPRLIEECNRRKDHLEKVRNCRTRYELCPITFKMISRYASLQVEENQARADQKKVFISHATKDLDFVDKLRNDLETNGFACFIAPESLKAGDDILEGLFSGISGTEKFLIILSKHSIMSNWVHREFNEALRLEDKIKRKFIVPIRLDDEPFKASPKWIDFLKMRQIDDFKKWDQNKYYRDAFKKLLSALK